MLVDLSISKIRKYLQDFDVFVDKVNRAKVFSTRQEAAQNKQKDYPKNQPKVDCEQTKTNASDQPAPDENYPSLDITLLASITDPDTRKKLVKNAIYPIVLKRVGICGVIEVTDSMANEENVNFTKLLTDRDYFDRQFFDAYDWPDQYALGDYRNQSQPFHNPQKVAPTLWQQKIIQPNELQIQPSIHLMSYDFYAATSCIFERVTLENPNYKTELGDVIYRFVVYIIGPEKAPEITDMLIDLSIPEILQYLLNFDLFLSNIKKLQALLPQQEATQNYPSTDIAILYSTTDASVIKQIVRNAIYPIVLKRVGVDQAGEVTGMMLDNDYVDFTYLLTNMDYFDKLVFEAYQTHKEKTSSSLQQNFPQTNGGRYGEQLKKGLKNQPSTFIPPVPRQAVLAPPTFNHNQWNFKPSSRQQADEFYAAAFSILAAVTPSNPNYKTQVERVVWKFADFLVCEQNESKITSMLIDLSIPAILKYLQNIDHFDDEIRKAEVLFDQQEAAKSKLDAIAKASNVKTMPTVSQQVDSDNSNRNMPNQPGYYQQLFYKGQNIYKIQELMQTKRQDCYPAFSTSQWNFQPSLNPMCNSYYTKTSTILAQVTPANQNVKQQDVGKAIYKFVVNLVGQNRAGWITDMLITLSNQEMLEYLQHFDLFFVRIIEVQALLDQQEAFQSEQQDNPEKQTKVDCEETKTYAFDLPTPPVNYPSMDITLLNSTTDASARMQLVGNAIFPIVLKRVGANQASKVTCTMLDEKEVNFANLFTDRAYFDQVLSEAQFSLSQDAQNFRQKYNPQRREYREYHHNQSLRPFVMPNQPGYPHQQFNQGPRYPLMPPVPQQVTLASPTVNPNQWKFQPSMNPMSNDFYTETSTFLPAVTPANPNVKTHVGQIIFKYVVNLVGQEKAPKVTGMFIDLSIPEMLKYLQHFDLFVGYISQAKALLAQQEGAQLEQQDNPETQKKADCEETKTNASNKPGAAKSLNKHEHEHTHFSH